MVPLFQSVALYQEGEGVEGEVEKGEVVEGSQEEVLHLVMDRWVQYVEHSWSD